MSCNQSDLLRLALTAHDAAAEPSVWPTFLAEYARLVGGDVALIQRHYLSEHRSQILAAFNLTPRLTEAYNHHYSRLNVWREHGRHLYVEGRVVVDPEMYPRSLLKRSEYYNDYMLPSIGSTHSMAGVVAVQGGEVLCLTALRMDQKEGWQGRDEPIVTALLPHVARAQRTAGRLQILEAGEAALNALTVGTAFLGVKGSVLFSNRAAQRAIAAHDGLSERHGIIVASDPSADAALQRLIQYAIAPDTALECPPDVLVPRQSLRRPYHISASVVRKTPRWLVGTTGPVALLVIVDPELSRPIGAEALRQGYGLTRKEAALAMALAEGETVARAAERLQIRYETARTHLRRILSKTQTSRQADLVALLESLASGASHPTDEP